MIEYLFTFIYKFDCKIKIVIIISFIILLFGIDFCEHNISAKKQVKTNEL